MKRIRSLALILILVFAFGSTLPVRAQNGEAHSTGVWTGSGWTLTLIFSKGATTPFHGSFRSARRSFQVRGDWIPAGDAGSDLLRFYGHPFTPTSPIGLVGVAILYNTCTPYCAASRHYKLVVVPTLTLPRKLPRTGTKSLALTAR